MGHGAQREIFMLRTMLGVELAKLCCMNRIRLSPLAFLAFSPPA